MNKYIIVELTSEEVVEAIAQYSKNKAKIAGSTLLMADVTIFSSFIDVKDKLDAELEGAKVMFTEADKI